MYLWGELKKLLYEILYFIFPPICPGCGSIDTFLCQKCEEELHPEPFLVLPKITASLSYKNEVVRRTLWLLKYQNKKSIAKLFGRLLFETIFEALSENSAIVHTKNYLIVAIPMSKKRLNKRGYNHAHLIAKSLEEESGNTLFFSKNALSKITETKNQAHTKSKKERQQNVANSMHANEKEVFGKHIILIDDIVTTGATVNEAMRALKYAGAKSVHAYVLAH